MFLDPASGQTVLKDEEADLIEPVGRLTQDWLNAGGLVVVPEKSAAPSTEAKGEVSDSFPSPDASSDDDVTPELDFEAATSEPPTKPPAKKGTKKK